jgi:hypothetical protein
MTTEDLWLQPDPGFDEERRTTAAGYAAIQPLTISRMTLALEDEIVKVATMKERSRWSI